MKHIYLISLLLVILFSACRNKEVLGTLKLHATSIPDGFVVNYTDSDGNIENATVLGDSFVKTFDFPSGSDFSASAEAMNSGSDVMIQVFFNNILIEMATDSSNKSKAEINCTMP
jgi:hypothetical protein